MHNDGKGPCCTLRARGQYGAVIRFDGDTNNHRVCTYIECDRITTSAPMESADQAARAGVRVSTTM